MASKQHMSQQTKWAKYLRWGGGISALALLGGLFLLPKILPAFTSSAFPNLPQADIKPSHSMLQYETRKHPRSILHIVTIPNSASFSITPIVASTGLQTVETMAQSQNAIAAINAGFFDPNNQQTTSFVIKDEQLILDPTQNSRLVDNPDLTRYMPQILNRSEFRRLQCRTEHGNVTRYALALRHDSAPTDCKVLDALGAGPALLPSFQGELEAFVDPQVGRDAIGSFSPNARSAVGITADEQIVFVMAAQRPEISPSGLTLAELGEVLSELGVEQGLNLDGGSSSSLYFKGQSHYGRLNQNQIPVERPVKSVLAVFASEASQ